ncbi:Hypothetical predicted protein [Cloeon dipterum]|uniref:Uncharacterized protein n=1 Tax=Cloeon dipterum TaxID=197152 RepID=A0A8S1BS98_9INSE|nr:Hypothetical predicted protein [Cloeon dipterum]
MATATHERTLALFVGMMCLVAILAAPQRGNRPQQPPRNNQTSSNNQNQGEDDYDYNDQQNNSGRPSNITKVKEGILTAMVNKTTETMDVQIITVAIEKGDLAIMEMAVDQMEADPTIIRIKEATTLIKMGSKVNRGMGARTIMEEDLPTIMVEVVDLTMEMAGPTITKIREEMTTIMMTRTINKILTTMDDLTTMVILVEDHLMATMETVAPVIMEITMRVVTIKVTATETMIMTKVTAAMAKVITTREGTIKMAVKEDDAAAQDAGVEAKSKQPPPLSVSMVY